MSMHIHLRRAVSADLLHVWKIDFQLCIEAFEIVLGNSTSVQAVFEDRLPGIFRRPPDYHISFIANVVDSYML